MQTILKYSIMLHSSGSCLLKYMYLFKCFQHIRVNLIQCEFYNFHRWVNGFDGSRTEVLQVKYTRAPTHTYHHNHRWPWLLPFYDDDSVVIDSLFVVASTVFVCWGRSHVVLIIFSSCAIILLRERLCSCCCLTACVLSLCLFVACDC